MDEDQCDVGDGDIIAEFADTHVVGGVRVLAAPFAGIAALLAVDIPNLIPVIAQVVFVIFLQFFQACFCHIHQLDAGFHRGGTCLVALGDVLFP